jgi:hypothetical protein
VKRNPNFVEIRPFRSRADEELEHSLEAKYRRIAIPELAEIVQQQAGNPPTVTDEDEQLH